MEKQYDIKFTEVDFTFDSGWEEAFSMRILQDGTIILSNGKLNYQYAIGKVSGKQLFMLDTMIENNSLKKFQRRYETAGMEDGYKFQIVINKEEKWAVQAYGTESPCAINNYANFFWKLKTTIVFTPKDTSLIFLSRKGLYPPRPVLLHLEQPSPKSFTFFPPHL